jgi:hypothetical protein
MPPHLIGLFVAVEHCRSWLVLCYRQINPRLKKSAEGPVPSEFSLFTPGQRSPNGNASGCFALISVNNKLMPIVAILAIF